MTEPLAGVQARKARALDIWESLKPDVEAEMERQVGGAEVGQRQLEAKSCFFVCA